MEEKKLKNDVWAVHYLGRIENPYPLCGLVPVPDRELFFSNDVLSVNCVDCQAEIKRIGNVLRAIIAVETGGFSSRHRQQK